MKFVEDGSSFRCLDFNSCCRIDTARGPTDHISMRILLSLWYVVDATEYVASGIPHMAHGRQTKLTQGSLKPWGFLNPLRLGPWGKRVIPGPPKVCKSWPLGLLLKALGQYFTYFLGAR